ncbi:hypothetical protein FACS1894152_2130 [Bacilli bacterium]|nr:hypothetical protein FACS1894152_2130 [Bacilli bacterium]
MEGLGVAICLYHYHINIRVQAWGELLFAYGENGISQICVEICVNQSMQIKDPHECGHDGIILPLETY